MTNDKLTDNRKPDWLKIKLQHSKLSIQLSGILNKHRLHTICESGKCPNRGECWDCGTATFMICGDICTRSCKFCNVKSGKPMPPDPDEPENIANSVKLLKLKHVVITSVDRDDLSDLGASHWVEVIKAVKRENPNTTMEALIPDFQGKENLIRMITDTCPEVISHNLETVKRLSKHIRSKATYETSLSVIRQVASSGITAKSGIMLGLGETRNEVIETMNDLLAEGCRILTIGQYLRPSKSNVEVVEYIHPAIFEEYRNIGIAKGFDYVESAPLVRSSYHAEQHVPNQKQTSPDK
ncbi:MAG: lipoyl synthase [Prevotellaceae bacterium]|jgi:lipoic acid synthetase|nr:lipoyl synthase [Prevotellaceae bacterium]